MTTNSIWRGWFAIVVVAGTAAAAPRSRDVKQAVPDEAAQRAATAKLDEIYRREFLEAAQIAALRLAFAKKLLNAGLATRDDSAAQYAALLAARDQAARAGNIETALVAVEALEHEFLLDALPLRVAAISTAAANAADAAQHKQVSDAAWLLGQTAAARDDMATADKLCTLGAAAANSAKDQAARDHWLIRRRQLEELKLAAGAARAALEKLTKDARDPAANRTLGRFRCLLKGDWPAGLLCLARGDDEPLRALAIAELVGPAETAARLKLGHEWWQFAQTQLGLAKTNAIRRAVFWYEKALPELDGVNKTQAEQRIASGAEREPATTIFAHLPVFWPEPPQPETSRKELAGTLYACGDDAFELAINGALVTAGRNRPTASAVTLKLGDVITARVTNERDERGLLVFFRSDDRKSVFFTNTESWHWYVPASRDQWMAYTPSDADPCATLGQSNYLRISEADGWGAEPIWRPDTSPAYLWHVVTERDLAVIRAPATAPERGQQLVIGALHASADDACDIMLNGLPILHVRSVAESKAVALAPGDVIAVKGLNGQYDRGVLLRFVTPDNQITFTTQTATWHSYTPRDPRRWWLPKEATERGASVRVDSRHVKIDGLPAVPSETIWGRDKDRCYLFHEVSEFDLRPRGK